MDQHDVATWRPGRRLRFDQDLYAGLGLDQTALHREADGVQTPAPEVAGDGLEVRALEKGVEWRHGAGWNL
jgi:hypothetical protein